jgi:plasmid stabilization system protein ParE
VSDYVLHPDAEADLDEIWEFIANNILDTSDQVIADSFEAIATLAVSPSQGPRRPDLTTAQLLSWRVHDF